MTDIIELKVNGVKHKVGGECSSHDTLLDYIRNTLRLHGTKYMCREGGCGACIVIASTSPGTAAKAVNSCLIPVTSCQDWDITTIEGMGNKHDGYHPIQKSLAEHHGTQCGYCTPGWIMALKGFLETNKNASMLDIEKAFGSNICRCTGYRSIAQCFKKFGKDAPKEDRIMDIENLSLCKKNGQRCNKNSCSEGDDWCVVPENYVQAERTKVIKMKDGKIWYRPATLKDVYRLLKNDCYGLDYMLIGGNTAKGVVPVDDMPCRLIDIHHLQELKVVDLDQNLVVGAGNTLSEFVTILKTYSSEEYFKYLEKLHDHVLLVAHNAVRNVGTIAGNLMIKHTDNSFQSDIFLILETVGAQLTIADIEGRKSTYTMQAFLKLNMVGKIILNVLLPPLNDQYQLLTYKLMPRNQSTHAIVNAGFLFELDETKMIVLSVRIVYGALSSDFIRATVTETYLVGKKLFKNETLQAALKVLDGELTVEDKPPEPSAAYRKHAAMALFYKCLLTLCPSSIRSSRYESGTIVLSEARGLSKASQTYATDTTKWPLTQPIQKVEALYQCGGEAVYTEDIKTIHNEVFAAFVLSTSIGTILKIDASEAMKLNGVLAFYTAKDIPGLNSFTPAEVLLFSADEEILADGVVKYYHQPIGIIVAESRHLADRAAKLVTAKYTNVKTPVIDIKVAKNDTTRTTANLSIDATAPGNDIHKVFTGNNTLYGQYHFPMETLVTVAIPTEEGLEVHSATQSIDATHLMISRALLIDQNKIDVHVCRLGGAFGFKISRSIASAVACSLVCTKLNRPCRFIQSLTTNMMAFGKRMPSSNDYEVAVNKSGVIQYVNMSMYVDNGYKVNETVTVVGSDVYNNCYDVTKFNYKSFDSVTDTPKNTFCRAPGTLEAIVAVEYVMERIAYELSLDPVDVRLANLDKTKYSEMIEILQKLKTDAEYATRKAAIDSFNTQNRWKKRGLRFSFCRWAPAGGMRLNINISVFHGDGTIVVTHGGIEMGQGINTKAVQLVAHLLGVSVDKIQVKCNNTTIAPNSSLTGGSFGTENVAIAIRRACEQLLERLEPIRATLVDPTWEVLVETAYNNDVSLQAQGFVGLGDIQTYNVYGMSLTEVEVDCLTGESQIRRVDIIQDVGLSFNPDVDVGQVEGGFIMAMGYFTCEKLQWDSNGKALIDRTWDYHVAQIRDIPQIFNVHLKKNSYSNDIILGCKGTGEPSVCSSVSVPFALREAITLARQESGIPTTLWFPIDGPYTTEAICMAICTNIKDFKFY